MGYKLMRLRKYYDALRSNKSFFKTSFCQQIKILMNILKFFKTNLNKPLIVRNKPVIAQIEPTSNCNLACEMCIRKKIGVPIGTMRFEDFKKILDRLDSLFKIHLSGQGEPFLNPDIFKMIKYANRRGITVHTTSNGTLFHKRVIDKICTVDIGEIAVSIDSIDKEKYEKIRKNAKFEAVANNIKKLTSELKRKKSKTIISIAVILLKENVDELTKFIEFAKKTGIKKVVFQKIQEKVDYIDKYEKEAKKQIVANFNETRKKIEAVKNLGEKFGISVIFDEAKSQGCIWPWRSIYITWNGNVTPCCKILDYRNPYFGNILKEDLFKIWNGKEYQNFRRLLRNRRAPPPCMGCSMV